MPADRGAIDAQLREIGEGERWWEQREFRDLPYILQSDENIRGIVNGKLPGRRRPRLRPSARWLIVATSQRVICLKQEHYGRKQIDIPLNQITRMQHKSRMRIVQITLDAPQRKYRIRVQKADAFRFIGVLAALAPQSGSEAPGSHPAALSLPPRMAAVAALPGMSGIVSRVMMLSPPDYVTRGDLAQMEQSIERLETEMDRLRQQVDFLESLLHVRAGDAS